MDNRTLPHNIDAERVVLASAINDEASCGELVARLKSDAFYDERHRLIWESICSLTTRSQPVDMITVSDDLQKRDCEHQAGGMAYLMEITESIGISGVAGSAKIISDKRDLRAIINASQNAYEAAHAPDADAEHLLDQTEASVLSIRESASDDEPVLIGSEVSGVVKQIQDIRRTKKVPGLASGFRKMDSITGGFQPGQQVVIAGRPGMGKTSLALSVALNVALRDDAKTVVIFSYEIGRDEMTKKLLSSMSGVQMVRMNTGAGKEELDAIETAGMSLAKAPIIICDNARFNVLQIRAFCRRVRHKYGLGLAIVDYLGLVPPVVRSKSRENDVSEISRSLKQLWRELGVPGFVLSQLSRQCELRGTTADKKMPILSDLRESGSVEQDADIVMFPFRRWMYTGDIADKGSVVIDIAKHRNGPTGCFPMRFQAENTLFIDPSNEQESGDGSDENCF
jgi:replicative DNA helicase